MAYKPARKKNKVVFVFLFCFIWGGRSGILNNASDPPLFFINICSPRNSQTFYDLAIGMTNSAGGWVG